MFQHRFNELRLTAQLAARTPLLINAGEPPAALMPDPLDAAQSFSALYEAEQQVITARLDAARAERARQKQARIDAEGNVRSERDKLGFDLEWVWTRRNGDAEPYLPGASVKGILRSYSERLLRTFLPTVPVCDIFDQQRSCTKRLEAVAPVDRYMSACPACRLFGCGGLAGRFLVSDAYLDSAAAARYGQRSGIGIDRERGAVAEQALFFYEVLEKGTFTLDLTLENFELWQVGLLAHTLHALWDGELPIGYGGQRGLGLLTGELSQAMLTYFGRDSHAASTGGCLLLDAPTGNISAEAHLPEVTAVADNDHDHTNPIPVTLPSATHAVQGLRHIWTLPVGAQEELWRAGAAAWRNWLATPTCPPLIEEETP